MDKFREVEKFLLSYNQKCRELKMLEITYNNFASDINEEIEARSLSHPAESDNIGAGRNLTISKKTENIALNLDKYTGDMSLQREQLKPRIKELKNDIAMIETFADNLSEINSIIFKERFMSEEKKSFNYIGDILNTKIKPLSPTSIRTRYNSIVNEFSEIAYKYISCNDYNRAYSNLYIKI